MPQSKSDIAPMAQQPDRPQGGGYRIAVSFEL
jgi:hypothetical protein